ncbi:MAG TPA: outer membrane beta-barrel protein [Steroidobacteraceae bacterium]|nr:outer membrane beta-barrel protein [Steroidobacteraceae bacterium]
MKKIPVIALVVLGLAFAGMADAAGTKKKRTRNQNRVGPYVTAFVGLTSYSGDQSADEASLIDILDNANVPFQNEHTSTEDSDIGYSAAFGYRFSRFIAGELALAQFGSLTSTLTADVDLSGDTEGFVPARFEYSFHAGGPVISVVGMLPIKDKLEFYGRVGYMFASVEREFTSKINGQRGITGNAQGDSQNLVYGAGVTWNISQVYSVRAEYMVLDDIGQDNRTGKEDLSQMSIGMIVRF